MAKTPHYREYHRDCEVFVHAVLVVVEEIYIVHIPCYWEKNLAFDSFPGLVFGSRNPLGECLGSGGVLLLLLGRDIRGFHSYLKRTC